MTDTLADGELFIIINQGSGRHDGGETREVLSRIFTEAGRKFRFVDMDGRQPMQAKCNQAARGAVEAGGILVAAGGDGTINAAASAAWQAGCRLGVLPQGTFNFFGRTHGIPQDLEAAARALLQARSEQTQVGTVNGRLFLVNASLGLYPQLLQDRETFKNRIGRRRWVAFLSGLFTIFSWHRQLVLELESGGERTTIVTPTLFVGNNALQMKLVGLEESVAARVGQGELAAVTTRPIGSWQILALLLRGAFSGLGDADQVRSFSFRKLVVRMPGRRKVKFAADGEVQVLTPPLTFEVSAKPLQLMLPREEDRVEAA
ncbi:MAG: diacylglycerol kinase [Comamonadaceae bacterium]|nr:MAG: diacylglycerol kinase [Comamonadaceae bacterium]